MNICIYIMRDTGVEYEPKPETFYSHPEADLTVAHCMKLDVEFCPYVILPLLNVLDFESYLDFRISNENECSVHNLS